MTVNKRANALVREALEKAVDNGSEIGIQVAAYHNGELVIDAWAGTTGRGSDTAVDGDTLFNVFSVAKAMTATALNLQASRGLVDYDAPVAKYWPEFAQNGKDRITVRHVLTHKAGLPQMPPGVTPEKLADWDWMVGELAKLEPLDAPGARTYYEAISFGWLVGNIVVCTDPEGRSFRDFVLEEITRPLGIEDFWIGLPDQAIARMATLEDVIPPVPPEHAPELFLKAMPPQISLTPGVFERTDVRSAVIPGVGGIANARSVARLFGMLANGGELDNRRLLPADLVKTFSEPRANADEPDPVMFNVVMPIGMGGYWLGEDYPPICAPRNKRALCMPGAGGSIAWADPDLNLAVGVCHNRMYLVNSVEEDPVMPVADAIREGLGLAPVDAG